MGVLKNKILEYLSPSQEVAATDYTSVKSAAAGVPITAQWRDNQVSVGGKLIKPNRVVDGKAIVKQSDVDSALEAIRRETGLQSGYEILEKYDKYKDMYDEQLDKLIDRDEFSYDAEDDPVFRSYKQQYSREGKRATEDTMGTYSALTGGMTNSGAVTAAAQSGQYWSDKLMDVIPELAEGAYDRYLQEIENDRKALADIMAVDTHLFEREYSVNEDLKNDIVAAQASAQQRDDAIAERNLERDTAAAEEQLARDKLAVEKSQNKFENALNVFKTTGEVSTDAIGEALGLPTGTVTAEIRSLFEKLAAEAEEALKKFDRDVALEKLKNANTLSQIYARK